MSTEFTTEEVAALISAFKALGSKPKCDTPDDLKAWMSAFATERQEVKTEPEDGLSAEATTNTTHNPNDELFGKVTLPPKIAIFSGEDGKDMPYDLWHYEVQCLRESGLYPERLVTHQVRKSLRGAPARVAMRLGESASLHELLDSLDNLYGSVQKPEELLTSFYNANQEETECVVHWSTRLEDLLMQAGQRSKLNTTTQKDMLRTKFWSGLRPALKERSRHKFDATSDFDTLRVHLRQIEAEMGQPRKTTNKTMQPSEDKGGDVKALTTIVQNLQQQVKTLTDKLSSPSLPATKYATHGYQQRGSPASDYQQRGQQPWRAPPQPQQPWTAPPQPAAALDSTPTAGEPQSWTGPPQYQSQSSGFRGPPQCWKCGQFGHLRRGCRAREDHLNQQGPMFTEGRH